MSQLLGQLERVLRWGSDVLDLNQSTLSGAIDIVVIRHADGTLLSTPFHVRFGKLQLLKSAEKLVMIAVNDTPATFCMKLGKAGEAFFVEPVVVEDGEELEQELATSPIESPHMSPTRSHKSSKIDSVDVSSPPSPTTTSVEIKLELTESKQIQTDVPVSLPHHLTTNSNQMMTTAVLSTNVASAGYRSWMSSLLSGLWRTSAPIVQVSKDDKIIDVLKADNQSKDIVQLAFLIKQSGDVEVVVDVLGSSPSNDSNAHSRSDHTPTSPAGIISSPEVEMSLCGKLLGSDPQQNSLLFKQNVVSFDSFCENPGIVFQPDLIIRYRDLYYPAHVALPLIISFIAFGKPLTESALVKLAQEGNYKNLNVFPKASSNEPPKQNTSNPSAGFLGWFSRRPTTSNPSPILITEHKVEANDEKIEPVNEKPSIDLNSSTDNMLKMDAASTINYDSGDDSTAPQMDTTKSERIQYRKTLRPSSEMLASLPLNKGINTITFSVHSALQGVQTVYAFIYLWEESSKIVISDVDGTITKSDLLGNIMPLVGRDWSHNGVTTLFTNIASNGYDILYLTSRAIGQANVTRELLHSVRQGAFSLPLGPIIMSPDGLIHSFKREVIDRRPQDFKIPALRDVRNLFPDDYNPFFAGFGNRDTDLEAYKAVGVPLSKIFIINPRGDIHHINKTLKKTYISLNDLVHEMFPPMTPTSLLLTEFSEFLYWKDPIESVPVDIENDDNQDNNPLHDQD